MRPWLKLHLLVLAAAISLAPGASAQLSLGNVAPAFSLMDLENNIVSLSDFENKAVLLFFLGYNCPYCRGEGPHVETKIWQRYKDDGFQVLGIDQ